MFKVVMAREPTWKPVGYAIILITITVAIRIKISENQWLIYSCNFLTLIVTRAVFLRQRHQFLKLSTKTLNNEN